MGEESVGGPDRSDIGEYCRQIELYLCRKNDGHLIRVVGPSFELVSGWASRGIPIKIAFEGIDRYFGRYYRAGPRRRPVKIDFCDADVLDVYEEWQRATGVSAAPPAADARQPSLPSHLERVVAKLTSARASGTLGDRFDNFIDRVAAELDVARTKAGGLRGAAREAAVARLAALDGELLAAVRDELTTDVLAGLTAEAEEDLRPFRTTMAADAYERARRATIDRLTRQRFGLPTILFT